MARDIPIWNPDEDLLEIEMEGGVTDEEIGIGDVEGEIGNAPVGPQAAFLQGEKHFVISSCVEYFQFLEFNENGAPLNLLYVGFRDNSVYQYSDISRDEALAFYHAVSPGGAVWDHLRVRGTVFGFQKPYQLVSGLRLWTSTKASIARHSAITKSAKGLPKGYHPLTNWKGARGVPGMSAVDLGRRRGQPSRKVAAFTPAKLENPYGMRKRA